MTGAQAALGIVVFLAACWALSEDRKAALSRTQLRLVVVGLILVFALTALLLKVPPVRQAFFLLNDALEALDRATAAGTSFVFGYLGGGPAPAEPKPGQFYAVLAFRYLPLILVVSALSALLYHWGIMQGVVRGFAWALRRTLGVGGALGVSSAVNVFVGMVEAPIAIRPYLARVSRGELLAIMAGGLATVAGTVMVIYGQILKPVVPDALGHILIASVVNIPAALLLSALLVPYAETRTEGDVAIPREPGGAMGAIVRGTSDGVLLLINVVAMLIVLVALVALANAALSLLPTVGGAPLTLERMFGWAFAPVVWLIGIPWAEAGAAGQLLGKKTILNEFIAYFDLAGAGGKDLSEKSRLVMTYAMCGFANLGSLGIMVGGMTALAPERRADIVALGGKSMVAGTLSTCLTAAVVAILA
jgi:CNT family concentrative nucleoside transporter